MKGILAGCALLSALTSPVLAQTDYYNTDRGRPVRIEDAYALEYRGLEIQAAPLRVERSRGGGYTWGIEPEVAIGFFPRTQLEIGFPLAFIDAGSGRTTTGLAGLDVAVLHNLNVETSIPALAIGADAQFPVGSLGPDRTYLTVTGIMTKTFRFARFHANAQYTAGDAPSATSTGIVEASRWLAGMAVDKTFPLRALLITAELYSSQPLHSDEAVEWTSGAGLRYQANPRWALDGGLGQRFTGADQAWYVTFGTAYAFGLPWRR